MLTTQLDSVVLCVVAAVLHGQDRSTATAMPVNAVWLKESFRQVLTAGCIITLGSFPQLCMHPPWVIAPYMCLLAEIF